MFQAGSCRAVAVLSPCRRVLAACCLLSWLSRLAAAFGFESPQSPGACPGPPALAAVVRWARLGLAWRPRAQCAACGPRQRSTEAGSASAELLTLGGCSRAQPLQRICISLHATTGASRWQLVGLCLSLSLCLPPSLFFFSLFLSLSLARALASLTALLRPLTLRPREAGLGAQPSERGGVPLPTLAERWEEEGRAATRR